MKTIECDALIVGGGVVGLSVAYELIQEKPDLNIIILEKEMEVGVHASGRNSGVLHSGLYYGQDSLRAKACSIGSRKMMEFSLKHSIRFVDSGKVIVPTSEKEDEDLDKLIEKAHANKVDVDVLDRGQLNEIEPFAFEAKRALYSPTTKTIDSVGVLKALVSELQEGGVQILFDSKFIGPCGQNRVKTSVGEIAFESLINCAGMYADDVAKSFGVGEEYFCLPFKGVYRKLIKESSYKVNGNIYPVPDPRMPFLGVHYTKSIFGDVYVGPTAIPALGRENYSILSNIEYKRLLDYMSVILKQYVGDEGFRLNANSEILKYSKTFFYRSAKKLMPSLSDYELGGVSKVGIRPQLYDRKKDELVMDYLIINQDGNVHLLNAISPAFTSAFAIAELIVKELDLLKKK
ncbi:L-2-hydroxyglutarate oxidase [Hydrogenovibrio sp. JE_KL2]|uniref:L-2-hydroxyglutarate oxidase n=1 Tax=Hydrogenovibrio sp. JE_KL2 TaxID=2651188 RepID=UPI00128D50F3|nr:L-2-hydroxyglutarate oxidase [Hydrogenovibrio sp. JE_KL2]MPQ75464.1 L-2-hydroxyglutarate oxidase [Hydrogenovibrio sp. JE_KL2]